MTPEHREAIRQAAKRDLARLCLLDFAKYTREGYQANWHHHLIADSLTEWANGDGPDRIILCMPPAHGKSELVSRCLPAWLIGLFTGCKVIACSHTQSLANAMSNDVQEILTSAEYRELFGQQIPKRGASTEAFKTANGSMYVCAGVGGPITGKHFDFGIIDDPIKNAEEAFSEVYREKAWQWYTRAFRSRRIGSDARMLLTTTRWHSDDLAGRILRAEPDKWRVINLPAMAEADEPHRKLGEPLWPERYGASFLAEEKALNPYSFNALYQQRPVAEGGGMFKRHWVRECERRGSMVCIDDRWLDVSSAHRFLTVDLAASTKTTGDYTVIMAWASFKGHLVLLDVSRVRVEGPDLLPAITLMLNKHNAGVVWVERIGFQTTLLQSGLRAGIPMRPLTPDKDKVTRAAPAAALMADGRLHFVDGTPWRVDLVDELLSFPAGKHDDQVDTLAYGVRVHLDMSSNLMKASPLHI